MSAFFRREFGQAAIEDRLGGADQLHHGDIAGSDLRLDGLEDAAKRRPLGHRIERAARSGIDDVGGFKRGRDTAMDHRLSRGSGNAEERGEAIMLKLHDELITELSNSLTTQNYNPVVVANHRLYARAFLDYSAECDIQVETVTPQQVDQYFGYAVQDFEIQYGRPPSARWHMLPRTAIAKLLRLAQGNWPPDAEMIGPDDEHRHEICREYEAWSREERGLASASIAASMWEARNFSRWQFDRAGAASLETLSIVDIDLYMDMRAPGLRRKSLADVAERLRSVVRHSHRTGRIPTDSTPHIIGPMLYAYEDVPSTSERSQIAAVSATTQEDRSPRGLRDYAILQSLATYGSREGEICRLRLDDVDWRAESLRICHTKTNAYSYMPLMVTVGEASSDYSRLGRPQVEVREIFVRSCAPYIAMTNSYGMIRGRLAAAGVVPAGKRGPHVFRHARAVEMSRASFRPGSVPTYRWFLCTFEDVARRHPAVDRQMLDAWSKEMQKRWRLSTSLNQVCSVDRFLDHLVEIGSIADNPVAVLRRQYNVKQSKPIWRASASANPDGASAALRRPAPFGSSSGDFMREHVALMRSRGYQYETQAHWLLRFDRFLQATPDSTGAS
ncbi:hypothetical protein OY671_007438, partial [Metschnikowia pulcherrima]